MFRFLVACLAAAVSLFSATAATVEQAAARFELQSAKVPAPLGPQFRALAAKALETRHPEWARKFHEQVATPAGVHVNPASSEAGAAIVQKLRRFRGLPTDADRGRLAVEVSSDIRQLPAGPAKLSLASNLCNLSTEGDLGQLALNAVAEALADSLQGVPPQIGPYMELASLVRYEHVRAPLDDPALDTALALLELRESLHQEAGLSLTALDGKTYSLAGLRGKVVLLNFWATWCPPCRKEMPDLDKLYREFSSKGLVVLAVSDEKRETVKKFLAGKDYRFPILLDPDRKLHSDFDVEGIPNTFLFDRDGNLIAQSIDMRTESQFRAMLKGAGLE